MAARPKKPGLQLNINAKAKSTDPMREHMGLNSPMTQVADPALDTPADNKLRAQVNSPKAQNEEENGDWQVGGDSNSALSSLVTQVERPPKKVEEPPKSVSSKKKGKKKSKGWCCCFSPSATAEVPKKDVELETSGGKVSTKTTKNQTSATPKETALDIDNEKKGLLGRRKPQHRNKKTLVIDLDETLVHSSFKKVTKSDFIVPVEIENATHQVYVLVRPHAEDFLKAMEPLYEIVLFTASLAKYADPLLDQLDTTHTIEHRLFRDSCVQIGYSYVKDLSRLGRKPENMIIIDNSPQSYRFQPENAVPITSWFDDPKDTELKYLAPVLENLAKKEINDVRDYLDPNKGMSWLFNTWGKGEVSNE